MTDKKTAAEPKAKSCFMITPIGQAGTPVRRHADWVFKFAVEPVAKEKGYVAKRADLIADPLMINDSVFQAIMEADVCIADLSFLNPNVFYELGVRHALVKPVIHIAQEETALPFDNAGYRTIMFDIGDHGSMVQLREALGSQIATIEQDGFKLSNPLTHAQGRLAIADSGDPKDVLISQLERRLSAMERNFSRSENNVSLSLLNSSNNNLRKQAILMALEESGEYMSNGMLHVDPTSFAKAFPLTLIDDRTVNEVMVTLQQRGIANASDVALQLQFRDILG